MITPLLVGRSLASLTSEMGKTWRYLVSDGQMRWVGPEKGVVHLAHSAVINAIWDLWAKSQKKPVWRLIADMSPEEYVRCIDFRYITDALTPEEAVWLLKKREEGKAERMKEVEESKAVPIYTTSCSWLGYSDEKIKELLIEAKKEGYHHYKMKVGGDLDRDLRRLKVFREINGWDDTLMMDSNQVSSCSQLSRTASDFDRSGQFPKRSLTLPILPNSNLFSSRSRLHRMTSWATPRFARSCESTVSRSRRASIARIVLCSSSSCRQVHWTTARWTPPVWEVSTK